MVVAFFACYSIIESRLMVPTASVYRACEHAKCLGKQANDESACECLPRSRWLRRPVWVQLKHFLGRRDTAASKWDRTSLCKLAGRGSYRTAPVTIGYIRYAIPNGGESVRGYAGQWSHSEIEPCVPLFMTIQHKLDKTDTPSPREVHRLGSA